MPSEEKNILTFILLIAGILFVFISDLIVPLGMAMGFGYIIIILFSSHRLSPKQTISLGVLCSLLIIADIFFVQGKLTRIIIFNRIFAVFLLALVTFVLLRLRSMEILLRENENIQKEKIQNAVMESQARLSGIVSSAMDAIITVNSRQEIILFNKAAEKMFGYSQEDIMGKDLGVLIPSFARSVHREYVKKFGETGTTNRHMGSLGSVRGLKHDGTEFPIEASISHVETSGQKLFTVILRDITERKQFEEQIKASLAEKEILLKEIHHRVKNNLQVISSLLNLQFEFVKDPHLLGFITESQNRIKSMALIHEMLYQSKVSSKINLKEYFTELTENLFSSYRRTENDVRMEMIVDPFETDIDTGIDLGLILNELLTNCFKYAFPPGFTGEKVISINLKMNQEGKKIILTISDTGVGIPSDFELEKADSLGLQLVNALTQKLDGKFSYLKNNGTHITITI